jgi:hypothetical protein
MQWVDLNEEPLALAGAGAGTWMAKPAWSVTEAATLLTGGDPDRVAAFDRPGFHPNYDSGNYQALRASLERAQELGLLQFPASPRAVCAWAAVARQELPAPLKEWAARPPETPAQRRARWLEWHGEEAERGRGAVQRVFARELLRNPKADRSNVGAGIRKAGEEAAEKKRAGVPPPASPSTAFVFGRQIVKDGKRKV